jgi:hypothetical protein
LPICADHSKFEFCPQPNDTSNKEPSSLELIDEEPAGDPQNNIIFNLKVSCPHGDSSEDKRKKAKGNSILNNMD